ncbi:hypothetical protein PoB_007592400 [Plakobranchus ocellatus]|uniref:Uncharacterized protein n=1 Tax=Plakobranchus ocellatus TaxID=259542 RepID=A0AAV4DYX8_9GAST|nr:hypothetical protein PoB_007592400 [Plakobranchus ocellatus]
MPLTADNCPWRPSSLFLSLPHSPRCATRPLHALQLSTQETRYGRGNHVESLTQELFSEAPDGSLQCNSFVIAAFCLSLICLEYFRGKDGMRSGGWLSPTSPSLRSFCFQRYEACSGLCKQ